MALFAIVSVPASAQDVQPCNVPVPPNTGDWKLVEITNVSFCVPVTWQVSATQVRTTGNRIRWGTTAMRTQVTVSGAPGGMSGTSIANAGGSRGGTDMARRITEFERIGDQMASVWYEEGTGRVSTGVSFTDLRPPFSMTGEASGRANVDLQIAIYRTIRITQ
jgi:hypothetical protein